MSRTLKYQSGDEIKSGDRVLFHGNAAEIEFVALSPDDLQTDWYVSTYGGGIMVSDPKVSGHAFIAARDIPTYEDLEFVSRATD